MGDVRRLIQQKHDMEMKRKVADGELLKAPSHTRAKAEEKLKRAEENVEKAARQLDDKLKEDRTAWPKDDIDAANEYAKPKEQKPIVEVPRKS